MVLVWYLFNTISQRPMSIYTYKQHNIKCRIAKIHNKFIISNIQYVYGRGAKV